MTPAALTEQQQHALAIARSLAAAGIPVFVAAPDPAGHGVGETGFWLPNAWQQTTPDPAAVDHWRPGMALCALMGCGLDLIDVDTRNGGDIAALGNELPVVLASATTPSGGTHHFIHSLGVGSRDGILPGIDLKGGRPDGHGRGCAFIAPTVRPSKTTGELAGYRWTAAPELSQLVVADNSGHALATRVRALLADSPVRSLGGPDWWREFLLSREPQAQAAADKAITEKLGEVTSWRPDSGANFRLVLMRAAMTLGGYVGGGYLAEGDAWVRLEQACAAVWGAADEDDRRWIGQGLGDGATRPFKVYTPADEALYGDAAQAVAATRTGPAWSPYRALGPEAFDPQWCSYDQEFAEAVAGRTAPVLRYAADASTWVVRGAEVWREREDLAGWAVAMVARLMPLGETPVPKDVSLRTEGHWQATRRQRFMTSGGASAIERKIKAIVRGGDHPSALELADLDTDPETLWAGGWPWDLRASAQVPTPAAIDPATPHLHTAACAPELRPTPVWDRFVATVWPDPELRAWAMRVLSVALAGYPDAALPVLYGPERTGKTSLIALLVSLLGTYGHAGDPRLLGGADTMHASVVYALKGRRLSFIDEGPRRGHLATERLKQLTGGAQLTGNAMRANPVTFNPTHTLVMTTNDEPPITDPALRARMRIIPCEAEQTAVRAARQAITPAVWELEAPGVLAALMRDCAGWLTDPASALSDAAPAVQREQLEEMAAGQDPVRDWVEAWTVPTEEGTSTRDLYTAFVRWYGDHPLFRRLTPPTETRFGRSLTELGYPAFWGGPRGKTRYRALSVMGGGSGGSVFGSLIPGGAAEGLPRVAEGSKTQLSATDKPRSSTVFDSLAEGAEGITQLSGTSTQSLDQKSGAERESQGKGGSTLGPSAVDHQSAPGPAVTGLPMVPADGSATLGSVHPGRVANEGALTPSIQPRSVDKRAAAERAYQGQHEKQISKAEARRQIVEERRRAAAEESARKRRDAIAAAAGEHVGLPAVATREGHVLAVTEDQAAAIVRTAMGQAGALTVDVETSGYPVGHVHHVLRTVQLGGDEAAVVLDPARHADLIRTLLAEAPRLHAHSAAADLVPLAHAGLIDAGAGWARMYDTVIPAKLADPQSTGSDPGLKQLAAAVLGAAATAPGADEAREALFKAGKWLTRTQLDSPRERSGWAQVDPQCATMVRYAASDVLDTAALARTLPAIPPAVLERERLAEAMTARVTHRGLRIDADRVQTLTAEHTRLRDEAGARVRAYGIDNPGSGPQVATALQALGAALPTSDKGNPSVAEHVLTVLKRTAADTPAGQLAAAVLDYRHSATVLGLFLAPYAQLCDLGDGRARPTIYTLGTDTGRMSAVRPNVQQLPREGGVRSIYVADPGHVFISADFSGVELRVAAALSQDPTMLQLLAEGRDLHAEVAALAFGEGWTKADRYMAKRGVFGFMYGGGVATLARQVGTTETEMAAVVDSLKVLTPAYQEWSEQIRRGVRQGHTQFPTYSGRIVHLPVQYPHKSPNYCVGMNTPVLRSDLQHVAASKIQVGDRLVAFDEHPQDGVGGQNRYHHLRTAVVEAVSTVVKPSLRVQTADGKITECSTDHLWLARRLKGRKNNRPRVRWMRADELQPGDDLLSLGTWEVADSRSAGYVAGLYDGEGSLSRHDGVRRKNQLFFSQNRGIVMDAMQAAMDELGLPYSYYHRAPNSTSTTDTVVVSGLRNVMRTLGTLQPARFRSRFEALYEGNAITAGLTESVAVMAIEDAGEMELASIQTSTRTLIANGYLSHNCIQGTAREALVDALIRWRDTRWGDATLLPVHDELVIQVPEQDAETATAELVRCMEGDLYGVRIAAEASRPSAFWQDSV